MRNIRYRNKYRIPSARAYWWNYGNNAAYFVTICTRDRVHYFGRIHKAKMELSMIGRVAHQCWEAIPTHFPFVKLGAFVVMPNHVHGIVIIDKPDGVDTRHGTGKRDRDDNVETQDFASLRNPGHPTPNTNNHPTPNPNHPIAPPNKFGPQSRNLGSIMRGYKIGVTKYARNHNIDFAWQSRFHDRIIRDKTAYQNISTYIINNPRNWGRDKFHT
ncbi:MAG: hypothetical protein AAFY20_14385 [Cyanobacteria bacterium J06639_14]